MASDFTRVLALDEPSLRALLDGNDARDRLWAVWALALKRGPSALAEHLGDEPNAGVRRHMCIVLAGGELDLLVAMARFDPDDGVRATASGLVARLAGGGRLPWSVAIERLDDPAVRAAVLRELTPAAPPELVAAAVRFAASEPRDVALEALDALLRIAPALAFPALAAALDGASSSDAYTIFLLWMKHADAAAIHEALRIAPVATRLAALRHFAARWDDVSGLALDAEPQVRAAMRDAFKRRLPNAPIGVLIAWLEDEPDHFWHYVEAIQGRLLHGESLPPGTGLLERCEQRLATVSAQLPAEITAEALAVFGEEEDELFDERSALEELIATIRGRASR